MLIYFHCHHKKATKKKDITTKLTLLFLLIAIPFIYKIPFFNYSLINVSKNIKTKVHYLILLITNLLVSIISLSFLIENTFYDHHRSGFSISSTHR